MSFSVVRTSQVIVKPSENTPSDTLDLSVIDRLPQLRINIQSVHVFKHGRDAAKVIREALSKALVPYYPLAGRLSESSAGELQISCTGEGVWFVEAHANYRLDEVNYFENVTTVPHHDLLPDLPPESYAIEPLVLMQVTQFTCEGFTIGLKLCHSICDGLGAAQFLTAIGEFARGLLSPRITPVWEREALLLPALLSGKPRVPPPPPLMPNEELAHFSIDISLDRINKLKFEYSELTGSYCSTFDVVATNIWRSRTRAMDLDKDADVKLAFFANARQFLDPPLPEGYYGNCFFPVTVTASSGWLVEASNAEIVKLIKEAKTRLSSDFSKWMKGDPFGDGNDPFAPPLVYTTLFISEWGRLGFSQIDYGWGGPVHLVPIHPHSIMPIGIVGLPPKPKEGVRLLTWCVKGMHLPSLLEHTRSFA